MPYALFILLPFLTVFLPQKRLIQFITLIIMTLIAGLRHETGGDWEGYHNYYLSTQSLGAYLRGDFSDDTSTLKYHFEFFFTLIVSISKTLNLGLNGVFLISAAIINLTIFKILKYTKDTINPGIFLMVFAAMLYSFLEMHYIRQGLASTFILLATIIWIRKKSKSTVAMLYFLAGGSHIMTTLVLIPIMLFQNISSRSMLILLLASLLLHAVRTPIFMPFIDALQIDFSRSSTFNYLDYETEPYSGLSITALFSIGLTCVNILWLFNKYKNHEIFKLGSYLIFIHAIFCLIFFEFPIFGRVYFTLLLGYPLLAAFIFAKSKNKNITLLFVTCFSIVYFLRLMYIDPFNADLFFPYKSILTIFN